MDPTFEELHSKHSDLLQKSFTGSPMEGLIQDAQTLLQELRSAGRSVGDLNQRKRLEMYAAHWGSFIFEHTDEYPSTTLEPAEVKEVTKAGLETLTVTGKSDDLRDKELAYLNGLLTRCEYWRDHYTPLAGIAEVRAAVKDGPRLDLPMPFIPPGFEKLVEHGYGERAEVRREPVDDLRQAVAQHRRIVLLGGPGSGKTTTLWRMAYDYAVAAQEDSQAPLPVLVPLGGYTDAGPFEAYLARHLGPLTPHLEAYRASRRLILLLDGLNEMPQADYAGRVGRIRDVLDRHPEEMVVVTCRALDYVVKLEQLQKVERSCLVWRRLSRSNIWAPRPVLGPQVFHSIELFF